MLLCSRERSVGMTGGFFALMFRMKYINRWGLMRASRTENLAEHSLEVALIAHAIASIGNAVFEKNYNCDRIAVKAMYHDAPEILTGDLPTPVKYHNDEIKRAYDTVENAAYQRFCDLMPVEIKEDYTDLLVCTDEEKSVIKAADSICAYLKCAEETNSGNKEFSVAQQTTFKKVCGIELPEAKYFIEKCLSSFNLPLDDIK